MLTVMTQARIPAPVSYSSMSLRSRATDETDLKSDLRSVSSVVTFSLGTDAGEKKKGESETSARQ